MMKKSEEYFRSLDSLIDYFRLLRSMGYSRKRAEEIGEYLEGVGKNFQLRFKKLDSKKVAKSKKRTHL